jgi:folate-binding protein YgfZ
MTEQTTTGFITIDDHALLLVKGPDAFKFLQGQVTCDVDSVAVQKETASQSVLGAHCTHKGRMLFSFRAIAFDKETIALSIYKPLLESAKAALQKYSIFSKVKLIDASEQYQLWGYIGEPTGLEDTFPEIPANETKVSLLEDSALLNIRKGRYEIWLHEDQNSLLSDTPQIGDSDMWNYFNIRDGLGEVREETVEEFIPQMLNLQVIDNGISFTKGCYTGQEVVARMKYLGKLKRYMHRFIVDTDSYLDKPIASGSPLFTADKKQSIGNVVFTANIPSSNQVELLAVVTEEAVSADEVYLDTDFQQKLKALPLPYAITKEE